MREKDEQRRGGVGVLRKRIEGQLGLGFNRSRPSPIKVPIMPTASTGNYKFDRN